MKSNTVLLVEDDALMVRVFERQFRLNGLDMIIISDGAEALTYLQNKNNLPALVCLDIMLPNVSGLEILKYIKSDPDRKSLPVIVLSNVGTSEAYEESKKLGVDGYFVKSEHDPQEIGDAVVKIVAQRMYS